jgi:23S rRNA G2445 N2-methylase RlmL
MRYFATAIPGIGPVLSEELAGLGVRVLDTASDGRNDLVSFEAGGNADVRALRTAEDVYVEVATARRSGGLSARLVPEVGLTRALSVSAAPVRPIGGAMSFRIIARVLSEEGFRRTELRDRLSEVVRARRPRWRVGDPAQIELWALEGPRDRFRSGIRLTTRELRHRAGREQERRAALRPTVAAAMVRLAGEPSGMLYDPFCGSGTILLEAVAAGWQAAGSDIDPDAVGAALDNGAPEVTAADARSLPLAEASVAAAVSNLPFGDAYELPADPGAWFAPVLTEIVRVTRPGAAVVLLSPRSRAFERAVAAEPGLGDLQRLDVELLGKPTAIWRLRRI